MTDMQSNPITTPDSPALAALCDELIALTGDTDRASSWPAMQLELCGKAGVFEWFVDPEWGGQGWTDLQVVRGYLALSAACLSTTFILTQRTGACRRIMSGENEGLKTRLLPKLLTAESFATVGISHLTTSHRHLQKPVLAATPTSDGFVLDGFSPWVTGGKHADWILIGAQVVENGIATDQQILAVVAGDASGMTADDPPELLALGSSHTGRVRFDNVLITDEWLVSGPVENVMMAGRASRPGGHETSTLALGLATAAVEFVARESAARSELAPPHEALAAELGSIRDDLLAVASGEPACSNESLRQRANSLVLRATQAALATAKGAGYVAGHPAGRWCREALFFLVWSCPQPVMNANLCELAGIAE